MRMLPEKRDHVDNMFMLTIVLIGVLAVVSVAGKWYQAGMQAQVYRRQGIEMTQWEVFIGIVPAERTVNLREAK